MGVGQQGWLAALQNRKASSFNGLLWHLREAVSESITHSSKGDGIGGFLGNVRIQPHSFRKESSSQHMK